MPGAPDKRWRARGGLLAIAAFVSLVPQAPAADAGIARAQGRLMAGVYSPDQWNAKEHITEVGVASGKAISIGGLFLNANESAENIGHMLEEVWTAGATPFVNIHMQTTAAEIAAGRFDDTITAFVFGVKNWMNLGGGRSLLLAPLPEMNGDWVPYGGDPANFKIAFTRIVARAEAAGLNETNTRWVFAPNDWSTPPYRIADYYPGPEIVDLIGVSTYNWGAGFPARRWTSVAQIIGRALNELRTFAIEKPFLVAQVASATSGGDRDAWLRDMFTYLAADPNVVAFVYFDIRKETDWAIYEAGNLAPGFREGMQQETTVNEFPLNTWFQPGPLELVSQPSAYQGRFADDDFSPFQTDIEWLLDHGITTGCGGNRFCPRNFVTRAEMATFMARALSLPATPFDYFMDDTAIFHESDINRIREAGITIGCGASSYCPNVTTTRAEIATFLTRALKLGVPSFDYFTDDEGLVHESSINALREAGITIGCGATRYCPDAILTREQMAALLHRALG